MKTDAIMLLKSLAVLLGVLSLPAWAAEVASAPAGEVDLAACLSDPPGAAADMAAQLDELKRAVEAAVTPADQAAAHLATANWLIAVPTARPVVRWLMGQEKSDDLRMIAARGDQAREHIEKARQALELAGSDKGSAGRKVAELKLAADSLEPFARLFAAAGLEADRRKAAFAETALGLAIARESDDPDISACALLWQSFAWELAGRRERAMASLPTALVKPTQPTFDFLSRLLRCRLTAEEGHLTAAFALTGRLRSSCDVWFSKEPPDQLAARGRLAAILQYRIGQTWHRQLAESGSSTAAADVASMLADLRGVLYQNDQAGPVFFLDRAMPILVRPPSAASGPAVTPASRPVGVPATTRIHDTE